MSTSTSESVSESVSESSTPAPSSQSPQPISVLFVCLGNICRSPMAEAVFRHLTINTSPPHPHISLIDSAGTGAYHTGSSPDSRTMKVLRKNSITGYRHAARKVTSDDFETFDWIFAMDQDNLEDLEDMRRRVRKKLTRDEAPDEVDKRMGRVTLFGDWGGSEGEEVIDPYYGADNGFDVAYEQMQRFSRGFLKHLESSLGQITND
jgi:low molecular weight phosphotyrosine protein phosphatase